MAVVDLGLIVTAINRASRPLNRITSDVDKLDRQARKSARGLRAIDVVFASIVAGSGLAFAKTILESASALEKASIRLAFFAGSVEGGRKIFQDLRKEFEGIPIDTQSMLDGFTRLKAAGLDPLDGSLKAIVDSVSAFGGGTQEINRAIVAIQQIAGKGVVSMEELRQQLGEAVPFAVRIMAEETGRSLPEFFDAVENGLVGAQEGIDAFIRGARSRFGGFTELLANTIEGGQTSIRKAWENLIKTVFDDFGLGTRVGIIFNSVAEQIDNVTASISQADVDRFTDFLRDVVLFGAGVVQALARIAQAVALIFSTAVSLLGSAGADILTSGVIGFFLFGRFGAAAGALLAILSRLNDNGFSLMKNLSERSQSIIKSLGFSVALGLIGGFFFGKVGILAGVAVQVGDIVLTALRDIARKGAEIVDRFLGTDLASSVDNLFGDSSTTVISNAFDGLLEGVQATSDVVNGSLSTGIDDLINGAFDASDGWKENQERLNAMLAEMDRLNAGIEDGTGGIKQRTKELDNQLRLMRAQIEASEAQRRIAELNRQIQGSFEISGFTAEAREAQLGFQREIEQTSLKILELRKASIRATDEEKAAFEANIATLETLRDTLQEASMATTATGLLVQQTWRDIGGIIDSAAKDALAGFVKGTLDLRDLQVQVWNAITDAAANYLIELIKITAQQQLFNAAQSGSGGGNAGFFGAVAGAFLGGFANGGIFPGGTTMSPGLVTGPTAFGVAGEAGAEAVVPLPDLQRLASDRGQTINLTVNAIDPQTGTKFLMDNLDTISTGLRSIQQLNGV